MKLNGRLKDLFEAFTKINETALQDERLISSHVLSKAPNYNDILKKFLLKEPPHSPNSKSWRFYYALLLLFIKYLLNNLGHLAFILTALLAIKLSGFKTFSLKTNKNPQAFLFIDTFLLIPKIIQDKCFKEAYLPNLKAQNLQRIYIFRLYGSRNPLKIYQAFKILSKQKDFEQLPFLALTDLNLLSFSDFLSLLKHIALFPFSLLRLIKTIKQSELYRNKSDDSPIPYILDSLKQSLGHCNLIPEARRLFGLRLGQVLNLYVDESLLSKSRLISWHENQSINKAFYYGLRQASGLIPVNNTRNNQANKAPLKSLPIIGLQLFIFPHNLLNCYPDALETKMGLAPDITMYSGKYFISQNPDENILGNSNSFVQKLELGASLRYAQLFKQLRNEDFKLARKRLNTQAFTSCLVLLSYHPDETRLILNFVKEISLLHPEFSFSLRFHPATQIQDFQTLLPEKYTLAKGSLYDNFADFSFVLGSGSGALTEAVALGVPAVHIDNETDNEDISLNYLGEFGKNILWVRVNNKNTFLEAIEKLAKQTKASEHELLTTQFRELFFIEPTQEAIQKMLK